MSHHLIKSVTGFDFTCNPVISIMCTAQIIAKVYHVPSLLSVSRESSSWWLKHRTLPVLEATLSVMLQLMEFTSVCCRWSRCMMWQFTRARWLSHRYFTVAYFIRPLPSKSIAHYLDLMIACVDVSIKERVMHKATNVPWINSNEWINTN